MKTSRITSPLLVVLGIILGIAGFVGAQNASQNQQNAQGNPGKPFFAGMRHKAQPQQGAGGEIIAISGNSFTIKTFRNDTTVQVNTTNQTKILQVSAPDPASQEKPKEVAGTLAVGQYVHVEGKVNEDKTVVDATVVRILPEDFQPKERIAGEIIATTATTVTFKDADGKETTVTITSDTNVVTHKKGTLDQTVVVGEKGFAVVKDDTTEAQAIVIGEPVRELRKDGHKGMMKAFISNETSES